MKVYISGQITGLSEKIARFNFSHSEMILINAGHEAVNPFNLPHISDNWNGYMKTDIKYLVDCDAIYMLRGWQHSKGANLEYHIAKELGLKLMFE